MNRERELLQELVDWLDGIKGKTAWTGEQTLRDFVLPVTGIAEEARLLLAQPVSTMKEEVGPPPIRHEQPMILKTVYDALEQERDLLVAELNRIHENTTNVTATWITSVRDCIITLSENLNHTDSLKRSRYVEKAVEELTTSLIKSREQHNA